MSTTPLRHLADVWTSSVDKHTREGEVPVRLCNYTDAYYGDVVGPSDSSMRATATIDEVARNRLLVGDTVLTKDSEDPRDVGISATVAESADDYVCGYHLAIVRPKRQVHGRFLTWALRGRPCLDHLGNHASGISRYGISQNGLRSTPVEQFSAEEQRRIADFLDDRVARIDQILAARREQQRLLRASELSSLSATVDGLAEVFGLAPLRRFCSGIEQGASPVAGTDQRSVPSGGC